MRRKWYEVGLNVVGLMLTRGKSWGGGGLLYQDSDQLCTRDKLLLQISFSTV